jgi:hypothetical protein
VFCAAEAKQASTCLLRAAGGLWRLALRRLSCLPLLLGLSRLYWRRRDRDRRRVRRGLRAWTMGVRKVLGRLAATGAAAASTGAAEPSTSIAAHTWGATSTIPRIERVHGTTMRTCNSASVTIADQAASTVRDRVPAPIGLTSVIAAGQTGKRAPAGQPATGRRAPGRPAGQAVSAKRSNVARNVRSDRGGGASHRATSQAAPAAGHGGGARVARGGGHRAAASVVADSVEAVVFEPAVVSAEAAAFEAVEASAVVERVQTSGSSTMLFCSDGSTMGLASTVKVLLVAALGLLMSLGVRPRHGRKLVRSVSS